MMKDPRIWKNTYLIKQTNVWINRFNDTVVYTEPELSLNRIPLTEDRVHYELEKVVKDSIHAKMNKILKEVPVDLSILLSSEFVLHTVISPMHLEERYKIIQTPDDYVIPKSGWLKISNIIKNTKTHRRKNLMSKTYLDELSEEIQANTPFYPCVASPEIEATYKDGFRAGIRAAVMSLEIHKKQYGDRKLKKGKKDDK